MGKNYRTIKMRSRSEHIEKKSRFIATVCPVEKEEDALAFIAEMRKEFSDATHNCYAYILRDNHIARFSDDGEPGGTAGLPMMEVLKKEGVTDVALVVTRYFGGIMLGAGGLVRAYSKGAKIGLDAGVICEMTYCGLIKITVRYDLYGKIQHLLGGLGYQAFDTEFGENVSIRAYIPEEGIEALQQEVVETTNAQAEFCVEAMEYRLIEV